MISDDWDFNYSTGVLSHIDGILTYATGSGTQPAIGEYIIGVTSGAVGKVLARTGTVTAGTLTLTNVIGQFENTEQIDIMSELNFDAVQSGGKHLIEIGVIISGVTSVSSMAIKFIEYNLGAVAGAGTFYGTAFSAAFINDEDLTISGTKVAEADGVGTDNDAVLTAQVSGTLAVPGSVNTNNCAIINYDTGSIAIPEDAHIQSAVSTAEGYAQKVIGSLLTGSIRIIDSDTTGGAWTDNQALRILDVEYYDTLVAGKVFSEGDVLKGGTSGYEARVLAVIDDGDSTGKLILAGNSGTPWTDTETIQVRQADDTYVTYANVESAMNSYLDAATINIPSGIRLIQRKDQGGIFPTLSLNLVRSSNAFYSYAMDLFDELAQLDDDPALEGNVRDQLYTILNDYVIPDLSFRFLEKGSFKDSGNNNILVNIQTTGAIANIGSHGFFYSASNPTPQPDMYIEQNEDVIRQDWLEGNLDMLLKVKTSTDPKYINPTVNALGQLIDGGTFITHVRPYTRTYDSNEVTQVGGIAVVALGNAFDLNNKTGQYSAAFTVGASTPFTVGEIITTSDGKRGQITSSDSGATGNITYVLKSDTNFVNTDAITGAISGATATLAAPTNLVAGYGTDVKVMTVNRRFTGGTTTVATYVIGETVTQTGTGATGFILEDDSGTLYVEDATGSFNGTGQLTGGISGALNTPTATAAYTTVPKDIGGGVGDKNYTAVGACNITGGSAQTVLTLYEWWKFLLRKESVLIQGGPGSNTGLEGRIYRRLSKYSGGELSTIFAEVRGASPYGQKAGSLVIGAQGMFIQNQASADLQNIQLADNLGDTYNPPNIQALVFGNLFTSVAAAIYRSTGAGLETILRTEFQIGVVGGTDNGVGDGFVLLQAGDRAISPLPSDIPDSGVLRLEDPSGSGNYLRYPYTSVDRANNRFTLQGTLAETYIQGDNAHVVLIEQTATGTEISNNIQYVSDIQLYAVARIKGKQPFKTTSVFGSTGRSIGAVLNADNVVNLP